MFMFKKSLDMPGQGQALPGRPNPIPTASEHFVNGNPLKGPYPAGLETAIFGMGCFWGAERKFWELGDGIYATAVGYAGGPDAEPDLRRGLLGPHRPQRGGAGGVRSRRRSPTSNCSRRSGRTTTRPRACARATTSAPSTARASTPPRRRRRRPRRSPRRCIGKALAAKRYGAVTTEILDAPPFYFAEDYHQQYLAKNPARLLRARRHRRVVSDRHRCRGALAAPRPIKT